MIKTLAERLEVIDTKVKRLAQKYEIIKKENMMLMEENIRLKQHVGKHKADLDLVGKNLSETSKDLVRVDANAQNNEDIKMKIDKYIKEIELCIELLENL